MIKIETVDNGWIITDETDPDGPKKLVVECEDLLHINPSLETMESFCSLLRRVSDLIGPSTSRYSPHRLKISLEPGDKHDPEG